MTILETIGAMTLGYLLVGSIASMFFRGKPNHQSRWLHHVVYTFLSVMCWPIILVEPFFPEIEDALLGPEGGEEDYPG